MEPQRPLLTCWICGKSVDINNCNTDESGQAVHEPCYVMRLSLAVHSRTQRDWRAIALEIVHEKDKQKIAELIEELRKALTEASRPLTKVG